MDEPSLGRQQILDMATNYEPACILGAAVELDLFTAIGSEALSAPEIAAKIGANERGVTILLDAVAALGLLEKKNGLYRVFSEHQPLLCGDRQGNILPMLQHRMNCLRGWSMLAWTTKAGMPVPRPASIRGSAADQAAFIAAMHTASGPNAENLVNRLGPLKFQHLLDVGGASGTWTLAFLRAVPGSRATIFDLPHALRQARERLLGTEFESRVTLHPGDFYHDEIPEGADFAWVSAIAHQHDRPRNRKLFSKIHRALVPGGVIAIRDYVMSPDHTQPVAGALFAVNMLANTTGGNTFTFDEFAEDLQASQFQNPRLAIQDETMNSVVMATRA